MKRLLILILFFPLPLFAQHSVDLTWTAPSSLPSGSYYNAYRGSSAGTESATPINTSKINITSFSDTNVSANTKYYYVVKACTISLASSQEVCSPPSNEVSATVPLVTGDLNAPTSLGAVAK